MKLSSSTLSHAVFVALLSGSVSAQADECPAYLDQSFTKLHSDETVNLCEAYGGQPMLIVNTASYCGLTPQFEPLEAVHQRYKDQGLVVVGFPSNDFNQEANEEQKTAEVCYVNYGVTFTMLAPSSVRGEQANPVFQALAEQTRAPEWNFSKYVLDRNGQAVEYFSARVRPDDEVVLNKIESLL